MAKSAEQKRRRELEEGFNNLEDIRQERVRTVREIADEYLARLFEGGGPGMPRAHGDSRHLSQNKISEVVKFSRRLAGHARERVVMAASKNG